MWYKFHADVQKGQEILIHKTFQDALNAHKDYTFNRKKTCIMPSKPVDVYDVQYFEVFIDTNEDHKSVTVERHGDMFVSFTLDERDTGAVARIVIHDVVLPEFLPNQVFNLPVHGQTILPLVSLDFAEVTIRFDRQLAHPVRAVYAIVHQKLREVLASTPLIYKNKLLIRSGLAFVEPKHIEDIITYDKLRDPCIRVLEIPAL